MESQSGAHLGKLHEKHEDMSRCGLSVSGLLLAHRWSIPVVGRLGARDIDSLRDGASAAVLARAVRGGARHQAGAGLGVLGVHCRDAGGPAEAGVCGDGGGVGRSILRCTRGMGKDYVDDVEKRVLDQIHKQLCKYGCVAPIPVRMLPIEQR